MSGSIVKTLLMEYKILKHNVTITKQNLLDECVKRNNNSPDVAQLFSILDCSIDQQDQLIGLARDDGAVNIMQEIIQNNFKHERKMIQSLAIKIYRVTYTKALQIIYDMCRRSIDEDLNVLHNDYEHLVNNSSAAELVDNVGYQRILELFSDHQREQLTNDALFDEALTDNNVDGLNQSIAKDIPGEIKIATEIRNIIQRLYNQLN